MPKVLVVDDSLSVRKVVERALVTRGMDVVLVASGKEAMEQIGHEEPDLVVCDVIMPDIDGYRICESVKTHPRLGDTPVLLISGIVNGAVLERAGEVRASEVLRKPFTAEELLRKVSHLLEAAPVYVPAGPGPALPETEPGDALGVTELPDASPALASAEMEGMAMEGHLREVVALDTPVVLGSASPDAPAGIASAVVETAYASPGPVSAPTSLEGHVHEVIPDAEPAPPEASSRMLAPGADSAVAEAPDTTPVPVPGADLEALLAKLAGESGVALGVLVDREGFVIESAGVMKAEDELVGALVSCLAGSSEGVGHELQHGRFENMIVEYEHGLVLLAAVDDTTILAVLFQDSALLGKVRYYVNKALRDLRYAVREGPTTNCLQS